MSAARNSPKPDDETRHGSGVRRAPGGGGHDGPSASGGMSIATSLLLSVGASILIATIAASLLNYTLATRAADSALDAKGASAARNTASGDSITWAAVGASYSLRDVTVQPARVTRRGETVDGMVYRAVKRGANGASENLDIVTDAAAGDFQSSLIVSLVGTSAVVVLVGAGVAFLLSRRIVGPLTELIEDVRVLSHGNLDHRVRVQAGGEVGLLAKSVDRMIRGLKDARESEREREQAAHDLQIAAEIRSSLLPEKTPEMPGFEVAVLSASADSVGGDLYDFVVSPENGGTLTAVVAGISARGVPGAMLMTMARAYLHAALEREPSPSAALKAANRPISRDMRAGLFVTAMLAAVDANGKLRVACAGHKAPAYLWRSAAKTLESIQPEGIALGFDAGPVFDRTLREAEIAMEPGDRIVLCTAGAFAARNADDQELGEEGFQNMMKKHAAKTSEAFCQLLGSEIERFRGDVPLHEDLMIVTIRRKVPAGART